MKVYCKDCKWYINYWDISASHIENCNHPENVFDVDTHLHHPRQKNYKNICDCFEQKSPWYIFWRK